MMSGTEVYKPGDVLRDGDGHPAVVLRVDDEGWPVLVLPVSGERARQQVIPALLVERVTSAMEIDRARKVAREEWRAGNRWEADR